MDYEKLHKDTIAKLQEMVNSGKITVKTACGICADFVPESEDERIRKELIQFFSDKDEEDYEGMHPRAQIVAWLEKQGEQNPVIEMKSAEESLGIDSDTYIKIVDECIYGEQKPAWSEEDDQYLLVCKNALAKYQVSDKWDATIISQWLEDKLKSLKDRVQPKQEWSVEDEKMIQDIINDIAIAQEQVYCKSRCEEEIDWLKSLRPQSHWKPSDEQMKFLWKYAEQNNYDGRILTSLYNDLKKLKE